ncbi:Hypothetical predicted protein [Mytilus galloprovincialis]|uniref:Uncharacterized protein n=1 Tax=Mytilus galloprovincialis TaxID=29158 RepID=A0A8B6DQA2_MYTGA|nr:Hypothetical predicted protein [Mytilus galloprovincialis]
MTGYETPRDIAMTGYKTPKDIVMTGYKTPGYAPLRDIVMTGYKTPRDIVMTGYKTPGCEIPRDIVMKGYKTLRDIVMTGTKVLFGTKVQIKEIDIDTGNVKILVGDARGEMYGMDYDPKYKYMYFTRYNHRTIMRFPYPSDNQVLEKFIDTGKGPAGLAIDSESGHVYWTEYDWHRLRRCDVNGINTVIISSNLQNPFSIRLSLVNRWMYVVERFKRIIKARFNYSEAHGIIDLNTRVDYIDLDRFPYPAQNAVIDKCVDTGSGPAGSAIDSENGHVYWTEYQRNRLMRCSVSRSNEVHIATLTSPFSVRIDVLNRYISYTTLEHNDIKSTKHSYLGTCVVVKTDLMTCLSCSFVI